MRQAPRDEEGGSRSRLSRRKFVAAGAAAGTAALTGTAAATPTAPTRVRPTAASASSGASTCVQIPNRYNKPFEVCDDELFIFMANYKPFENPGFFDAIIGDKLRAAFPDLKIKAVTWD
ncbi:hypothetical protein AB4Z54_38970, partial [Streptomyces sp. MCAF7]